MKPLVIIDLGNMGYGPAHQFQRELAQRRSRGDARDTLILVEHEAVYTVGLSAGDSDILLGRDDLISRGIEVHHVERGGKVTYHGPGQVVAYPILLLDRRGRGARWYVAGLEQVMVRTLTSFGIVARSDARDRGAWVGDEKIGAIGVKISHRVTTHGFSINVCPDLSHYDGIVPCGIRAGRITSLRAIGKSVGTPAVKHMLARTFAQVFGYDMPPPGQVVPDHNPGRQKSSGTACPAGSAATAALPEGDSGVLCSAHRCRAARTTWENCGAPRK